MHSPFSHDFDLRQPASIGWCSRASPLHIPDSPEALFEALTEPLLEELYPNFETLKPRNQKLIRLLHTELTKGELTDNTFQEFVGFVLVLWRSFNRSALLNTHQLLATEDEIDTDWVDDATQLARMDQYLTGLLAHLEALPAPPADPDARDPSNRYLLRETGEA